MQRLLAIESTCDETAAAILDQDNRCLASSIASQEQLHQTFSGVVPEIAARAHLERILPVIDEVMSRSQTSPRDLAAIAVATHPELPGSLLVGLSAAKALAVAWQKPLVGINHVHAHIYACQMESTEPVFPCVGFVVSGGHTNLYRCESSTDWKYLGGTIDDAAGEAFDKVAVMLGLPYPGGPHISKLAATGNEKAYDFPRPMLDDSTTLNMSFSGLKTAVRYRLVGTGKQDFSQLQRTQSETSDLAASFEAAVIDCLVGKAMLALKRTKLKQLCVGGGVAANRRLRSRLQEACVRIHCRLAIASSELCTDNAVMGGLAWEKIKRGQYDPLDLDIQPGLLRN